MFENFNRSRNRKLLRSQKNLAFHKWKRQLYPVFYPISNDVIRISLALNFVVWKQCRSICIWKKMKENISSFCICFGARSIYRSKFSFFTWFIIIWLSFTTISSAASALYSNSSKADSRTDFKILSHFSVWKGFFDSNRYVGISRTIELCWKVSDLINSFKSRFNHQKYTHSRFSHVNCETSSYYNQEKKNDYWSQERSSFAKIKLTSSGQIENNKLNRPF